MNQILGLVHAVFIDHLRLTCQDALSVTAYEPAPWSRDAQAAKDLRAYRNDDRIFGQNAERRMSPRAAVIPDP
jgi:hypothetical protein